MSDIKKPEDIGSKLQSISNDVNAASLPKIVSAYNVGRANDFSAKQNNLAKYVTYGSETYGKLGFDPFKTSSTANKSGMDDLYDTHTSWTSDIGRAYTGMKKLAGIGIMDTIGLGAFADQGNYLTFEDTMNKYSSSRGGTAGFWSNTMLSSGYTMGIIAGIAAEELALAGITAATGGMAAPGTIAAGGTLLARGVARIKEAGNMLKAVNKLQDLNSAKGFLGATGKFVGGSVKSFAKALNPLENTYDFLKTIDKLEDFNGWRQTAIGAGAIVRDARKITMSHSESKLEADLAAKEFRQQMFDDYYLDKSKIGTEIPESQLKLIDQEAKKVEDRVYAANFGLIYATNAITFDNMFKSMKGTNRWAGIANDAYRISRKEGGKVAVDVLAKTFGNSVRKKLSQITLKGSIKSALSSSMEGVQELGQDMISESMKSYHARNVKGTQVRGGFLEYLHNDLAEAANKQYSEQGLSTFLSGALMGVFASPVGFATGQVNNFLAGGGIQNSYARVFDNKKWKADKLSLEVKRKEKAKVLTEFFNNNKNFIDGFSKPIYRLNELQERILEASENNNAKAFNDNHHESFVTGIHSLLEAGLENEFADHLEYMSKNFGAQELNEVFGRTDITEENKAKYQEKLKAQANNVKQLRAKYNEIQSTIVNPHKIKGLKVSDPNYLETYIKWRSVENLKKELLFSDAKIADRANRIEALKKEINQENPLSSLEINSLLSEDALQQQIDLLETEVKANAEMKLSGQGAENAKKAQQKLEAYKAYQEKLTAFTAENQKEDGSIYESDAYEDLFEAYNNLMGVYGKNTMSTKEAQDELNKKQFDKIFDYISLGEENKFFQEYVDTLLNPAGASAYLQGQEEMLKRLDESKEDHIMTALKAFEEKSTADDMLNALYNEGLFFDLNELDDLLKNRMMPSEIYNIEDNNKPATPEQIKTAQDIIEKFVKRLTGKSIVNDKTVLNKQGRKLKSDKRTVTGIINQYNLKLNKEIKLSSKQGQRLLEKMMAKENKFLTRLDREILAKLGEQDVTIKFITDGTLPVQMSEDGVLLLDLRFTGREFKNSVMSFENLMVTALTQNKIAEQLKEKDDLWLAARNAMEQAKAAFQQSFPSQNIDEVEVFDDPVLFLTEAMNDIQFQKFLGQIEDDIQPASNSLWNTLMEGIEEIVDEEFDKRLGNRVINIAAKALDDSIVDNIAEETEDVKEVREEKQKAKTEKFDELTTLAKELGLRWNVNVKVIANQEEANKILNNIQDPFFQKFSTILNDALWGPSGSSIINLRKTPMEVDIASLLRDVYEKSESISELITNLKELSIYQTNGKIIDMVDWLVKNGSDIADGIDMVKDIFFQAEGEKAAGFYDEKTNTAYIIADAVQENTVYHEIFLHPFLINLEKTNPDFYKKLVEEAKANQEAVDYVERNYGTIDKIGVRQFEHELVGRVYDLNVNNQLSKTKDQGLLKTIGQFIKKMFASVAEYLGIAKTDIKRFNEKKTTIADLAKYAVRGTGKVDLGAIIEADKVIRGTTATPKTKTTKVQRKRVITTEKEVNVGGNVIVLDNASDRTDLFEEFLHPEVSFENRLATSEWTNKIVQLGKDLDAENVTDWEYGNIRAQIDGRLVIDVSAKVNGKTVRFLMYKSIGKGTSLSTKGEWVPLLAIGTHTDGTEWFVKALYQGNDPKINKYGSDTFLAIDQDLKAREADLFTEPENWETQQVEEEIIEEVEEEVPVTGSETPSLEQEPGAVRSEQSYIDEAEQIKNRIAKVSNQLDNLNKELADNKLSFVQKRSARKKITELSIELNELYQQLNDIQPNLDALKTNGKFEDTELEYEPKYDYNGNEIITYQTPWPSVPKELRGALAALFGKPLNKITEEDVMAIREEMKSNPEYIAEIAKYSDYVLSQQNEALGLKELEENRKKVEAAKKARQEQLQAEKEQNRIDKKQRRQLKAPIINENYLKNILKDYDYSILTPKEIDMLVEKMRDKTSAIPFTVNDVIAYISNKKAQEERKALERKVIDDIEKVREKRRIDQQIKDNFELLQQGKIRYKDASGRAISILIPKKGMVKFITTYYPEIFALDKIEFLDQVKFILDQRKAEILSLKANPIQFKPKGINIQLKNLFKKLEKENKLFPDVVYQINLALYKAGSNMRIKAVRGSKNNTLSSMYIIGKKSASEKRIPVSKGKYTSTKSLIQQSDFEFGDELNSQLAIVKYLMSGGKVQPTAVYDIAKEGSTEAKGWASIISTDADKATASDTGAGEFIMEKWDLNVELGQDAFNNFINNHTSLKNAIDIIGERILNFKKQIGDNETEDQYTDEDLFIQDLVAQGLSKAEAADELRTLQFLNSEEGKAILDEEAKALDAYYSSMQSEILDGEYEGDPNELSDEDLELFNQSEEEVLDETETEEIPTPAQIEEPDLNEEPDSLLSEIEKQVTDLINENKVYYNQASYLGKIWDNLNKEQEGNLVYAIAAYKFSNQMVLTPNQLKATLNILNTKFRIGVFNDKLVNINGKPFRIAGYQQNKIVLQDLQSMEFVPMELSEFMTGVKEVLKPGTEFNAANIDSVVNVAEFAYIKEAYDDILNNFTSYMGEANSLSEEDLMVDLNKEITKCK